MMQQKMNLNETVWIRLTPQGEARLRAWYIEQNIPVYIPSKDVYGYISMQLWDMMWKLGPTIFQNYGEMSIEENTILLVDPKIIFGSTNK